MAVISCPCRVHLSVSDVNLRHQPTQRQQIGRLQVRSLDMEHRNKYSFLLFQRVSVENFCGLKLLHNSVYFNFEVFRKQLIGVLICFNCNVYFEPIDIKNLLAGNGQIFIVCGTISFFTRANLANFILLNKFSKQ